MTMQQYTIKIVNRNALRTYQLPAVVYIICVIYHFYTYFMVYNVYIIYTNNKLIKNQSRVSLAQYTETA